MSIPNDNDVATNFGYGSADETASLLVLSASNPRIVSAAGTSGNAAAAAATTSTTSQSSASTTASSSSSPPSIISNNQQQQQQAKLSSANNGPSSSSLSNAKPTLIRQDRTSTYLISPSLSQTVGGGYSEESAQSNEENGGGGSEPIMLANSVTDLDIQYNRLETPVISISNVCHAPSGFSGGTGGGGSGIGGGHNVRHRGSISGYQISSASTSPNTRCRTCRSCDRRASTTPVSSMHIMRSVSKESVRSNAVYGYLSPSCGGAAHHQHSGGNNQPLLLQHHQRILPPPVLITGSPGGSSGGNGGGGNSRIIRQSSQPEASNIVCCGGHNTCNHSQTAPSVSLKQLRENSISEGIAGIAVDSLKINGAMKPFKQVMLLMISA